MENGFLLRRISECYYGLRSTESRKKDNRNNENSKHGAGKPEYLHEVATIGNASAVVAASIFHFSKVSIRDANRYLKERAIPVETQRG